MHQLVAALFLFGAVTWGLPAGTMLQGQPAGTVVPQSESMTFGLNYSNTENRGLAGMIGNAAGKTLNAMATALSENLNFAVNRTLSIMPFPAAGRRQAVPEQESKLSMLDSAYSAAHQFVNTIFNHRPIVDTIQEHEKYGNNGDKYRTFGVAVVNGFEGFSNFLNSAVEVPFVVMKKVTKQANDVFNSIGGKITGL